MSKRIGTHTWMDGFGVWRAQVSAVDERGRRRSARAMEDEARAAIHEEIAARQFVRPPLPQVQVIETERIGETVLSVTFVEAD